MSSVENLNKRAMKAFFKLKTTLYKTNINIKSALHLLDTLLLHMGVKFVLVLLLNVIHLKTAIIVLKNFTLTNLIHLTLNSAKAYSNSQKGM